MRPKLTSIERLMLAMDRCALARAQAQWTNGYRAARDGADPAFREGSEGARMWAEEQAQWKAVDRVERQFRRTAARLLREARQGGK